MVERPGFTLGIEEEYLIVDRDTRDVVRAPKKGFLRDCGEAIGGHLSPEFLQCQVEVGTGVHKTAAEAGKELAGMRRAIAAAAEAHGYAAIAASTHPFARWREQKHTKKKRYNILQADLGATVRRMLICGCHVHIGIEDPDLRIDLMNQVAYFLPHLLALSTSSPFWEGEDTGLASYRLTVFDALPRTGLPDVVHSDSEYRRLVDHLVHAGCIEDATKIWWDIRPSDKFPTLEQRVTDVCSRVADAVTIAALFQALLAMLWRLRSTNQRWRLYPAILINENRWRAQRYGRSNNLVDHGRCALVPFSDLVDEIIALTRTEAELLGSTAEITHARKIAAEGTSADRQRATYAAATEAGADPTEALRAVVDQLVSEYTEV
ncbi:carboxylate-amine ligase [Rhodobacteraceae bacterium NNCM2]|nr:carboxylate-amine ligase [Coraliihabitans acroporae]